MSDSEAARESLPSISDLSLNPQTTPSAKPVSTEGKPKKDVEKGWFAMQIVFFFGMEICHTNSFFAVEILLKPTGSAPIINKNKWSLNAEKRVSYILYWLHSYFKLDAEEKIVSRFRMHVRFCVLIFSIFVFALPNQFVYVNQTFAPAPDQTIKNLYDCYGTNGKLILHYSKSPAWG